MLVGSTLIDIKTKSFYELSSALDIWTDFNLAFPQRHHAITYQVQAPFETRPGEIPRRIQIERKRRLYLQHRIEALLLDRGVDHTQPPKSALSFLSPSICQIPVEVCT